MTASPLHVAMDMTFPDRNLAGSGLYARELLAALERREDVRVTTISEGNGSGLVRTLPWLLNGANRAAADAQLVHCPAFVAPWRIGKPLVLTIHDTTNLRFPEDQALEWALYTRHVLPERARSAARVITGTEFTRRDLARDLGLPEERIAVTPYGVSQRFAGAERPRRPVADPPLLLFPGAPNKRKNLELVLLAMARSPEGARLRQARLAISGARAESRPRYKALIESLGLTGRVEWRGPIPDDAMPGLLAEADLVVYPSLYEGFGFPPLEAMLAGTPVVASNAGCLPEVLGDAALLVDPNDVKAFSDAVEAALTREELRCELVAKGKVRAAAYTWERCAALTAEVYRAAAGVNRQ